MFCRLDISISKNTSIVPFTSGMVENVHGQQENCLVVFCDDFSARSFLKSISNTEVKYKKYNYDKNKI